MRGARGIAAVAGAALVLGMSGCGNSPPKITDAQVATWKAKAVQTIPTAMDLTIRADYNVAMFGSASSVVNIDMVFSNFADLKASEPAILDLQKVIVKDVPKASLHTVAVNSGASAHEAQLGAQLAHDVPGTASAKVIEGEYRLDGTVVPPMWGNLQVFVDDVSVVSPSWLDQVSAALQAGLDGVDGQIADIYVLPASAVDLKYSDPAFSASAIRVGAIQAFKDRGVSHGCVRTDSWAYDVSNYYVSVYPKDHPGGNCA
jgi:hypothetical protein